ncbi:MAG TPA: hypothetical protein PLM53_15355 [Spirochaetota bacterium]|nr:hypothetical protein [Spirochaetota bacterium]HPC42180.1 hypothetical protein [Spirochaetota bacterium]HQF09648.1 hypothetical protein [Spirochaetota bacterium]HQH98474.1 hypothetical protein [Spirochaetota bacterium]HQJ73089.1 hypothetical protein [Spirochaetota bacterium]
MDISAIRDLKLKYPGIILEDREILLIAKSIREFPRCSLLVFGMGNDTPLWLEINAQGRTAFLENSKEWHRKVRESCPTAESYLVTYTTKLSEWEQLIDDYSRLTVDLPPQVTDTKWDVILVDGPSGDLASYRRHYGEEPPGRMSSIYMSSLLIKNGGYVFVHDCNRIIERQYSDRYLFDVNLVEQTRTKAQLRKYRIR